MRRRAFTLIELLIVIAIIAALAAIIFPVFFSVRAKARQTVCVSNLRQIGLSIGLYAQDADEQYPNGNDPSDTQTVPNIWTGSPYQAQVLAMPPLKDVLDPYIHNKELWHCPSDSGYKELDISAYNGTTVPLDAGNSAFDHPGFGSSYLYRTEISLLHTMYGSLQAVDNQGNIHEGSEVNVLMDGNGSWHGGGLVSLKRYNELMGDGHVINQNITQFGQTWELHLKHS